VIGFVEYKLSELTNEIPNGANSQGISPGLFKRAVRGELTVKLPREAEKDLGNVSANRSDAAKSADLDRVQPLLPVCLR
jgi:hypothetical protein